jgi:Ferritin-like domain
LSDPSTRPTITGDPPSLGEPRRRTAGLTRAQLLKRSAAAGGIVTAGALFADGLSKPAVSQPSAAQDERVLEWLLQVEQLQADFYTEAEQRGALRGELRELAERVGKQERAHVAALERALDAPPADRPEFDFGEATSDPQRFLAAALQVEDLALAAVNGQVPNLTKGRILMVMGIASVEARHVGWLRDLAGRNPAPRPADAPATQEETRAAIRDTGFME